MKWNLITESGNDEVKSLLLKAMDIAKPKLANAIKELVDKYLNVPQYNGRELDTWQEQVEILKDTLDDVDGKDKRNQKQQIYYLKNDKPDFVYWYYGDSERRDPESIIEELKQSYPDYDIEDHVHWRDTQDVDVGFIYMNKRK